MAVSCGLLSADWGNIADWAAASATWATAFIAFLALFVAAWGVVFSLIGAVAVAYLGWKSNALADEAHQANTQAMGLETRTLEQDQKFREFERTTLLAAISTNVRMTAASVKTLMDRVTEKPNFAEDFASDAELRSKIESGISSLDLPVPDGVRDRLQYLGNNLGAHLLRAASTPRVLVALLDTCKRSASEDDLIFVGDFIRHRMQYMASDLSVVRDACIDSERASNMLIPDVIKRTPRG
jgi:hypothetical protein